MAVFKCKMCGGGLEVAEGLSIVTCEYCGTTQTLPRLNDDKIANLYDRANHFRRSNDYDKAMGIYEQILNEDSSDSEAYWSLVLCRYGIEYVEDPTTKKRIPTVNRAQFTSIFSDEDYKSALQYADNEQKAIYEEEAKAIDNIQKGILEISNNEEPFDVFICYKETDNNGRRTPDSVLANDLYHQLTQVGFKVFFARITLEDKLGSAYEPYIFAALNSAKVMVVLGTKPEFFKAVWVKNEWSRYLALIKNGAKKILIPAYRDMDPYDLPEEFSHLQAQDMSKLGFMQDLIRGIKKITEVDIPKTTVVQETVVAGGNANTAPLLKRAFMFLEDGDWNSANEYCEKVLDIDPENAEAYLGKLLAELKVRKQESLKDQTEPFNNNNNYQKAIRFADEELKNTLTGYIAQIDENVETARKDAILSKGKLRMTGEVISNYESAIKLFESITGWKDANEQIAACQKKIEEIKAKESADRLEKERQAEIARKEAKKRAELNKRIAIILSSAAAFVIAFLVVLFNVIIPAVKYSSANKCVESKEYLDAIVIYEELADYKDSADKIISTRYLLAISQLESKEYQSAYENFTLINDYKDSAAKRQESCYGYAQVLMADKKYQEAIDIFGILGDYEKSADLKNQCYLKGAKQFYANKEYYSALTWYEKVKSYDKKAEFYTDSCYHYAVQQINSGSYGTALAYLKKAGNHSGVNNQIKAAKYGYVKANKNNYDNTTFEFLKELKSAGYKDSASIYKELYAWKVDIVVNDSEDDDTSDMSSISKYSNWYFHVDLSGGEPGAEIQVKYTGYFPNGDTSSDKWDSKWSDGWGGTCWFYYNTPVYGQQGTFKLKVFDGRGNLLGEKSVKITG